MRRNFAQRTDRMAIDYTAVSWVSYAWVKSPKVNRGLTND